MDRAPGISGDRYVGWHAGLAAVSPDGSALWRFTYGRSACKPSAVLKRADARLSFLMPFLGWATLHTGAGTGLTWVENSANGSAIVSRHRVWMSEAFGGFLLNPAGLLESAGLFPGTGRRVRRSTPVRASSSSFKLGVEAGWRTAARSLSGPEARIWLQLAL